MKNKPTKLSIFDSFKTKGDKLTGEAVRQRHIISHLAREENSLLMTRTAISQNIAEKNKTASTQADESAQLVIYHPVVGFMKTRSWPIREHLVKVGVTQGRVGQWVCRS